MSNEEEKEPKIVVDDDWKAQVAKEKAEARRKKAAGQPDSSLPPASFSLLVSTLASQSLALLGFIPNPETGKPQVNRPLAKHFIDMLGVIESKTAGNLDEDEQGLLTETLHQLRMAYLSVKDEEPAPKSTLELP